MPFVDEKAPWFRSLKWAPACLSCWDCVLDLVCLVEGDPCLNGWSLTFFSSPDLKPSRWAALEVLKFVVWIIVGKVAPDDPAS